MKGVFFMGKKLIIMAICVMSIMCMAVCFATSSTGAAGFVDSLNTGLSMTALWDAISPIAPLIITLTLIAVTRYVINKNLLKAKKGGAGRV